VRNMCDGERVPELVPGKDSVTGPAISGVSVTEDTVPDSVSDAASPALAVGVREADSSDDTVTETPCAAVGDPVRESVGDVCDTEPERLRDADMEAVEVPVDRVTVRDAVIVKAALLVGVREALDAEGEPLDVRCALAEHEAEAVLRGGREQLGDGDTVVLESTDNDDVNANEAEADQDRVLGVKSIESVPDKEADKPNADAVPVSVVESKGMPVRLEVPDGVCDEDVVQDLALQVDERVDPDSDGDALRVPFNEGVLLSERRGVGVAEPDGVRRGDRVVLSVPEPDGDGDTLHVEERNTADEVSDAVSETAGSTEHERDRDFDTVIDASSVPVGDVVHFQDDSELVFDGVESGERVADADRSQEQERLDGVGSGEDDIE
jgi:hypothetical protein